MYAFPRRPGRAVVIGCSIAGMMAARVLRDAFDDVVVIERDTLLETPAARTGVAQSWQPHILLSRGIERIDGLFPGFIDDLIEQGAVLHGPGDWRFISHQGEFLSPATSISAVGVTRPLFEWTMRNHLQRVPGVTIASQVEARALVHEGGWRINGIVALDRASGEELEIAADLLVDAGGRRSHILEWLVDGGYERVPEVTINAGVGYASRFFHRSHTGTHQPNVLIQPRWPDNPRMGVLMAVEGDRWQVMLAGQAGSFPPTDDQGFIDWAQSLPDPAIYQVIRDAEPCAPIRGFRIPETRFRRFDRLSRWPARLLIVGDAVAAFNPLYSQGMSVSAIEADAVRNALRDRQPGWERRCQKEIVRIAGYPWATGAGEDLRWDGVMLNGRPADQRMRLLNRYVDLVSAAATRNHAVSTAFLRVINLEQPPSSLTRPGTVARVIAETARGQIAIPRERQGASFSTHTERTNPTSV